MMITGFDMDICQAWRDASFDESQCLLVISLISNDYHEDEGARAVPVVNGILDYMQQMKISIHHQFLGASKLGVAFPQIAFALPTRDDALKMHGAVAGFFVNRPELGGYSLQYNNV